MSKKSNSKSKNNGGRPLTYKAPEEMQEKIDEYFILCAGVILKDGNGDYMRTDKGGVIYEILPKPPTVTGLALALGFSSRQALLNYQGKPAFNYTVTRAKLVIEEYAESRLFDKDGVNGAKFSLTNNFHGWSDKSDINLGNKENETFNVNIKVVE